MELFKDGFMISTDLAKQDLVAVHHFLSTQAYWCLNIPFERVKKAAEHSLNFGLFDGEGRQIGYARVISDRSTIAYLGDVYVLRAGLRRLLRAAGWRRAIVSSRVGRGDGWSGRFGE